MTIITEFEGLGDLELYFRSLPDLSKRAMRLAINTTVGRAGLKYLTEEMYSQVAFPAGYLKGDRLGVTRYATENNLEAVITGRKRATSLARFAAPGTPLGSRRGGGVTVTVRRGKTKTFTTGWLVRLRRGKSLTEDNYNVGLAVRVKQGDSIIGKHSAHQAWLNPQHTVALLYGPSVDQVFAGVIGNHRSAQHVLDMVAKEFIRQFDRLS